MLALDLLLGIDFGTGGCKVSLVATDGTIVDSRSAEYSTRHPHPGWSEQNPDDWYTTMCGLLREMRPAEKGCLLAVATDSYTHGAVLLDERMRVIRPTIIWTDQRSATECRRLTEQSFDLIFDTAFQAPTPTWTLPQLLWLRNHEPDSFSRIRHISFVKDYIRYLLTGILACDRVEAQGSLFFDMKNGCWSEALCALADIPFAALPPIGQPTDAGGTITARAAAQTGLPEGLLVILGASDTAVEAFAAGAIEPGQCVVKLATAGNVNVMTSVPHPHPKTLTYSHLVPGVWYTATATNAAAVCQRWFRDLLALSDATGGSAPAADPAGIYDRLDELAATVPVGANGVLFHPYLMGERSPYWDPDLRGSFTGLNMSSGAADLSRALLEGVAFSLRDCQRILEEMGLSANELLLIGGGARSKLWPSIVCDVFNKPLRCPTGSDASFGSALLAGVGCGVFADCAAAVRQCVKIDASLDPDPARAVEYARIFQRYRRVHDALEVVYRDFQDETTEAKTS